VREPARWRLSGWPPRGGRSGGRRAESEREPTCGCRAGGCCAEARAGGRAGGRDPASGGGIQAAAVASCAGGGIFFLNWCFSINDLDLSF